MYTKTEIDFSCDIDEWTRIFSTRIFKLYKAPENKNQFLICNEDKNPLLDLTFMPNQVILKMRNTQQEVGSIRMPISIAHKNRTVHIYVSNPFNKTTTCVMKFDKHKFITLEYESNGIRSPTYVFSVSTGEIKIKQVMNGTRKVAIFTKGFSSETKLGKLNSAYSVPVEVTISMLMSIGSALYLTKRYRITRTDAFMTRNSKDFYKLYLYKVPKLILERESNL